MISIVSEEQWMGKRSVVYRVGSLTSAKRYARRQPLVNCRILSINVLESQPMKTKGLAERGKLFSTGDPCNIQPYNAGVGWRYRLESVRIDFTGAGSRSDQTQSTGIGAPAAPL